VYRVLILAALAYAAIILIMCLLESRLVFQAVPASERWQSPPDPDIQDVTFAAADGTLIHGW
jgi:hypothetical protein